MRLVCGGGLPRGFAAVGLCGCCACGRGALRVWGLGRCACAALRECARCRCARVIERGAAEGLHPACWYLWLSARLMRGCAFVGACACRHTCRMFHVKQCEGGNGFEPGLGRLCGRCMVLLLLPVVRVVEQ